jgi:maleate isomerase
MRLIEFLDEAGFGTTSCAFLGLKGDIFRVSSSTVDRLVRAADRGDAEGIFISCTNLWTREIISALEHDLGKAVLSANQVTAWAALKAAGIKVEGAGQRLFTV